MTDSRPDAQGRFGAFGGCYVAETLQPALEGLAAAYRKCSRDRQFQQQLADLLADYVGRPTPLYQAARLGEEYGCGIWLKREDLSHTGAHKINNTAGQILLAGRMGKRRIIAETGAGQHGVATATVCARAGIECVVYMGGEDVARQAANVDRMRLLGAQVRQVDSGSRTLKDALNEALRDWVTNIDHTYYAIGSAAGPHPYPQIVRDFNAVVGKECRQQVREQIGRMPDAIVACVGGGSNAIGIFHPFIDDAQVRLIGVEAGGCGIETASHAAPLASRAPAGILHGMYTRVMQDKDGQILETSSVAAGLDYPAVGPEHAWLHESGRAEYVAATDGEALAGFDDLCRLEGIIPALESAHAIAHARKLAGELGADAQIVVNLSGRGDKDLQTAAAARRAGP